MPHEQQVSSAAAGIPAKKKSEWCADTLKDVLNMQRVVTPTASNLSAWSVPLRF